MLRVILNRVLVAIPVLMVVAVTVFFIIHLTPGDPASVMLGPEADPATVAALRESLGLDRPLYVQFFSWFGGLFVGDLGDSIFLGQSVAQAVFTHIGPTLQIAVLAQLITIVIAIPMGVLAARRKGRGSDQVIMAVTMLGTSVPAFLVALLLVLLLAVTFRVLPAGGYVDPFLDPARGLTFLLLPAISLAAAQTALLARMTRSSMIEILGQNYIRTARAKGAGSARITVGHALRNASIPLLTVVGQSFGLLIGGSVVIETVFNIPGLGQLIINAITRRDYPVIQGIVLVTAVLYVLINLIVDIAYGLIDPRVRVKG